MAQLRVIERRDPAFVQDKIVTCAMDMFNTRSSGKVSTNHIAAAAGISAGTVYYYFRNKEEIIREIFRRLYIEINQVYEDPDIRGKADGMIRFWTNLTRVMWRYRFCYMELNALVKRDPLLGEMYRRHAEEVYNTVESIFVTMEANGTMKPGMTVRDRQCLVRNAIFVGQLWISYADLQANEINENVVAEGILQVWSLVKPYFTDHIITELTNTFSQQSLHLLFAPQSES